MNHDPLISVFRRFLPLALALTIIASFLRTQPQLAANMYNQVLYRFRLASPPSYTQNLNDISLAPLIHNSRLDQAAKLITMSILSSDTDADILPIDQAAKAVDYPYKTITYLAGTYPLPPTAPIPEAFTKKVRGEIPQKTYQQYGLYQHIKPDEILMVAVIAAPATQHKTSNTPTNASTPYYTGTQLWQEIQKYRREHGVPEFKQDDTLCTISSIRVNQLLELGKLDNHAGFTPLVDQYRRSGALTYGDLAENILQGYPTPSSAIDGWDSSLGHQALLKSGAHVWGCASANAGFAVLIAAY